MRHLLALLAAVLLLTVPVHAQGPGRGGNPPGGGTGRPPGPPGPGRGRGNPGPPGAPELDLASGRTALVLVAAGLLLIAGRPRAGEPAPAPVRRRRR